MERVTWSVCVCRPPPSVNERVYESELEHAHRNYAIAHMLGGHGILTGDPTVAVQGYTRQCSPMVTVKDLALMAATLANYGVIR